MPSERLKVLSLNTTDIEGGAARAAFRLHRGLLNAGVEARLLVQKKIGDDPTVQAQGEGSAWGKGYSLLAPALDLLPLQLYPQRDRSPWSCNWLPKPSRLLTVKAFQPDVIHLHWVGAGMLPINRFSSFSPPLVWTLHDMWAFTGGCHYDMDCGRYQSGCGECPQLHSRGKHDLSYWCWRRKSRCWADIRMTLVCPSRWLASCAEKSPLFSGQRIEVIPNGLDLTRFKPMDRRFSRKVLGIPEKKKIILFGAMNALSDPKKGFNVLSPALQQLQQRHDTSDYELLIFGASKPLNPPDFGFVSHYLGALHDDISLTLLYSAADVTVVPSRHENLSNVVIESLACGTPVVAFNIGGMPDMIDHQANGYLARAFEPSDLARGIEWVLEEYGRWVSLSNHARSKAESTFALPEITARYLNLYNELVSVTR